MKSHPTVKNIIAVNVAAFLILSSGAPASNLLGLGVDLAPRAAVERPAGLFDQVAAWMMSAWTDLELALAEDAVAPAPTTETCDAGWGLDPEGCPNH